MSKFSLNGHLRLSRFFFLLWQLFASSVFAAYGIQEDSSVRNVVNGNQEFSFFHYSSVAVFDNQDTSTFGDDELAGMAKKAWFEMRNIFKTNHEPGTSKREMPTTMAALAVGDRVYFASSVTGGGQTPFFVAMDGLTGAVPLSILDCLVIDDKGTADLDRHRYKINCGEMLAIHLYGNDEQGPQEATGVMVAVGVQFDDYDTPTAPVAVWNACSAISADGSGSVGCENVLDSNVSWLRWVRASNSNPSTTPRDPSSTYNLQLKCN